MDRFSHTTREADPLPATSESGPDEAATILQ